MIFRFRNKEVYDNKGFVKAFLMPPDNVIIKSSFQNEERVPAALHLRFQAELNQMESIQEAERQLNKINQIRSVASATNDVAALASLAQVILIARNKFDDFETHFRGTPYHMVGQQYGLNYIILYENVSVEINYFKIDCSMAPPIHQCL
jgi:hypothetical protein